VEFPRGGGTLQRSATLYNTPQQSASQVQHTAIRCNKLPSLIELGGGTLQQTATLYSTLQQSATHYNALQHAAKHCNRLGERLWC